MSDTKTIYYARQIEPDLQESPLILELGPGNAPATQCDELDENIAIFGNKTFKQYIPNTFQDIMDNLLERDSILVENVYRNEIPEIDKANHIREAFGIQDETVVHGIMNALKDLWNDRTLFFKESLTENRYLNNSGINEAICRVMSIITGNPWKFKFLHGSAQSEWNVIHYDTTAWSEEAIDEIEAEYFNTGTEWIIHDTDKPVNSASDVEGYTVYTKEVLPDKIREYLAMHIGCFQKDLVLFFFDKYLRIPTFRTDL